MERRLPQWSELRPLLQFEPPALDRRAARLARLSARATEPGTTGPADASASARTTSPEA